MALANIGYSLAKQGRREEAVEYQLQALQHDPDEKGRYRLCWDLGWNFLQIGRLAEALDYTEQAIRMREYPDLIPWFNKGLILLGQGKDAEAKRDLQGHISSKGMWLAPGSWLSKWVEGKDSPES
ncbi:MAG: tetratricopeptide repeat protein [Chloroflexota bacterium]